MKGQMHTDLGQVIIDEEVIATYAELTRLSVLVSLEWHL